jgi:hypothetical protein
MAQAKSTAATKVARLQTKTYRLSDNRSGESCMVKTGKKGDLTIFDAEEGRRRAIRHCPNQRSIYVDEQDAHSLIVPIIFQYGQLEVSGQQPITQAFLDAHPANVANGGGWFETVNEEQEAKESIQSEELKSDIMQAVRDMAKTKDGIHELSAVVAVLLDSVDEASRMGVESLKRVIYNEIEDDPTYFVDEKGNVTIFEDDGIKRKYLILKAIKEGIIKKSPNNRSMVWAKDNKVIATAPRSIELVEYFSDYLSTEEGMLVLEEISRRS